MRTMTPFEAAALLVYRSLLICYPGEFREEYGRELCVMLSDQIRAQRSAPGAFWTWLQAAGAVLVAGPRERWLKLVEDIRLALRSLARAPMAAALVVLIFALGTGSSTAVFTLANGVLLRPLPYPDQDRLVYVSEFNA